VGVGEHQHRVLAAQLDRDLLLLGHARLRHHAPDRGGAREEHLVHRGARQRHADRGSAVHDPHEALRQAGAGEHACDPLAREARALRGLEHHPVARQQRPRDLAQRLRERRAARSDHADDAVGLVGDARPLAQRQRAVHRDAARAQHPRALVGDPQQRLQRRQQLERRDLRARAALLAGERLRELLELVDDRLRDAAHVARAVLHPQQRPQRLHLAHRAHHALHVPRCGDLHAAQRRPGRGVVRALLGSCAACGL
jgi:hypothetical protein